MLNADDPNVSFLQFGCDPCFKAVILLQGDDDDTPELGFNFSDDSRGFSEASQSQMSQPSLPGNDSGLNATSLTGDKLLSQPYKVN